MKTFTKMQFLKPITLVALLMVTLLSCRKFDEDIEIKGNAKIRVVNAVSASNPQDFYQNDKKLSTTPLAYGQSSEYLTIPAGVSSMLSFKNTGTDVVTASSLAAPQVNASYTGFYLTNANGSAGFVGFADDTTPPDVTRIKVRFLNLGMNLNNGINVTLPNGNAVTTGLAYGYLSVYNLVDANLDLSVAAVGSSDVKVIPATALQPGKIYTIWFDTLSTGIINYHIVTQN